MLCDFRQYFQRQFGTAMFGHQPEKRADANSM